MIRSPMQLPQWFVRIAIVAVFFAAVAPTLGWLDFYDAEENVVIATAMETRRDGHWLVPTLQGQPRMIKPPLTVWMTALAMRPSTLSALDDPQTRAAAYRLLGFEARWPSLLLAGLMLVAVFELGRALGGSLLGLASACVCGTTWFFILKQGTKASTDLQLAFWVTAANAFFAHAMFGGRSRSWILGGAALGMALMSKGPVALLQTLAPLAIHMIYARIRPPIKPILIGLALMLIFGFWWYAVVLLRAPEMWSVYAREITRKGANTLSDPWYQHLRSLRLLFPWLVWFGVAIAWSIRTLRRRIDDPVLLAIFMFIVPFVVMTLFRERKERYLTPLIAPAAVMTAHLVMLHVRRVPDVAKTLNVAAWIHWIGLAVVGIGLPIFGAATFRAADGSHWFSWPMAATVAIVFAAMIAFGLWIHRTNRAALIATTVAVMLIVQLLYQFGFSRSDNAQRDMRTVAADLLADYPNAEFYSMYIDRPGIVFMPGVELAMYTNRTVPRVGHVSTIPQSNRPHLILAVDRKTEPIDLPAEPWREILNQPHGKETWRVFVR